MKRESRPGETGNEEVKCTTCYMCACRCGIRVHLRDREVRYIDDNPDHPLNQGVICAKGASGAMNQYSPARLTRPLLRKPGTDGALLLALIHEIIAHGLYDRDFPVRYTNGGQLVNQNADSDDFGLFVEDQNSDVVNPMYPQNKLWWDRFTNQPVATHPEGADPYLYGAFALADGTPVMPAFQLKDRVKQYTPEWAAGITGVSADCIRRLANEMGVTARDQKIELPIRWTDCWGREHQTVTGCSGQVISDTKIGGVAAI
jgi:anaerobic selenocysteine-containing dehydrogenase